MGPTRVPRSAFRFCASPPHPAPSCPAWRSCPLPAPLPQAKVLRLVSRRLKRCIQGCGAALQEGRNGPFHLVRGRALSKWWRPRPTHRCVRDRCLSRIARRPTGQRARTRGTSRVTGYASRSSPGRSTKAPYATTPNRSRATRRRACRATPRSGRHGGGERARTHGLGVAPRLGVSVA